MAFKSNQAGCPRAGFEHDACGIGAVVSIRGVRRHSTVDQALKIVEKLEHRAGKDAEGKTGDGVGILLQIAHGFFAPVCAGLGIPLGGAGDYGVGMFFFPRDSYRLRRAKKLFEIVLQKEGLRFLGWRALPVCGEILGARARACMPAIWQGFVERPQGTEPGLAFDRRLYVARREFEKSCADAYVASLSSRTIVYKGMFLVGQLRQFYPDLTDERYTSAIALVHSRFSTNTTPSWERAHPNRLILHNGEINTIRGNFDRMLAREETMRGGALGDALQKVYPVIRGEGSDSAMLDNTLEFLVMNGLDLPLAVMITIPEPWENDAAMDKKKRDFYRYYATMMEPWDGPASILFSDGETVGAVLDRNGLRPSRYYVTDDDMLILASEVGVLELPPARILQKGRLEPGKMLLVDTVAGRLIPDGEIKARYASRSPYGEWLDRGLVRLRDLRAPGGKTPVYSRAERAGIQKAFGYSYEDIKNVILPMAQNAAEPVTSMGADTPLAVLSDRHPSLFSYFKQLFAQVTNPPIDAIREEIVTATTVYIGVDGNLLHESAENCRMIELPGPILTGGDLLRIRAADCAGIRVQTVPILYYKNTSLKEALEAMFVAVDKAYRAGVNVVILSDRGVNETHVAIPSLLAVSALEQYLVRTKKRTAVSVILESAEPREVHQFAALLGYGARAVYPYLAHETIGDLIEDGLLDKDYAAAVADYNEAALHGIVKILSKMGISTIQSYQSAQIFEAVGINREVIDEYFTNTVSRVQGIGLAEIARDVEWRHNRAFDPLELGCDSPVESDGVLHLRAGKEQHLYNPQTIHLLQQATRTGDYALFKRYSAALGGDAGAFNLRGLLDFKYPEKGVPLEEVEPVGRIVRRFQTGAMSFGSLSKEAHETLAVAMNALGGKSNCGEGGEETERLSDNRCSAIKQVASGRFGVNSRYLMSAKEIQIKMAQGAKPGEGGQLPGRKVYPWVAKTRHSTPGVPLISPPPHHDIYSIEDLAQLIYDLKNANRRARISVKLTAEAGVDTIAAGVAKAGAGAILISGFDGGTGAAPQSSVYNAGLPWELGLMETHKTLIRENLRDRVLLETDGKLMCGRDVAVAAMLGAEVFCFATAPLVTMGCVMMRVCSQNTCPAGIATQDAALRKRFTGKPEYVINFMRFVAAELREIMAKLGVRTVDELVGRTDLLTRRAGAAPGVDLGCILDNPYAGESHHYRPGCDYDFHLEKTKDAAVLLRTLGDKLAAGEPGALSLKLSSTDRAFGTIFSSEITRLHGDALPDDTYCISCRGGGGQSFGAFAAKGLTLRLEGDANDYVGKGLSGGRIAVYPPRDSVFAAQENVIIGNVALYGATAGEAYFCGVAGERFAVRNSGAVAVVEGVGDHGCEYMTGGEVLILGHTGKNFAAGMSGGVVYVLDPAHDLYERVNKASVSIEPLDADDAARVRALLGAHLRETGSRTAARYLEQFDPGRFKKVIAADYRRMQALIAAHQAAGKSREQAEIDAFNEAVNP